MKIAGRVVAKRTTRNVVVRHARGTLAVMTMKTRMKVDPIISLRLVSATPAGNTNHQQTATVLPRLLRSSNSSDDMKCLMVDRRRSVTPTLQHDDRKYPRTKHEDFLDLNYGMGIFPHGLIPQVTELAADIRSKYG